MSRASINTGQTFFGDEPQPQNRQQSPMRIVFLGDFTGRESRGFSEVDTIAHRQPIRVTKDNFERVFENLSIRLKLPTSQEPLCFTEFDDLHPDFLYERLPLFSQFKKLNKQLMTPDQLPLAAREIQQWASFKSTQPSLTEANGKASAGDFDSMLDALLSETRGQHRYQASPDGQIDQLIKDIVSPYISPKTDPRQAELLSAVEAATAEAMRKLLHHSEFQQLEASWRCLHFLIKRLDSHSGLSLEIFDVSKTELLADLAQADSDLEQAGIFKALVANQAHSGQVPYHAIVGDFYIDANEADLGLVIDMPTIAQSIDATFITGAKETLAGCQSLGDADNPDNWQAGLTESLDNAWQAIRDFDASKHCLLSAPRFLLRTPYGQQSTTIDNFNFEELPEEHAHEFYLWGNSAYLQVYRIAQGYLFGNAVSNTNITIEVDQLPLHVYKHEEETRVKPCAEINMTDSTASALTNAGISVVRSVLNQDKIILSPAQSLLASASTDQQHSQTSEFA